MAELSRISSASDHRVILASVWFLYHSMQSSGSSEMQVDVEARALNLGIDVLRFLPLPSIPSFLLLFVSSHLSRLRRLNSSRRKMP